MKLVKLKKHEFEKSAISRLKMIAVSGILVNMDTTTGKKVTDFDVNIPT